MSKNNPVGNIPIETPILTRMENAVMKIYMGLSEEEMKSLQAEIQSVTGSNCNYIVYDIAQMMKYDIDTALKGIF